MTVATAASAVAGSAPRRRSRWARFGLVGFLFFLLKGLLWLLVPAALWIGS